MGDPYQALAKYYDVEHADFTEDLGFYRNIIAEGPVLEVGSGTGRVLECLLEAGFDVTGIDPSAAMLAAAGRRLGARRRLQLLETSVLKLDLEERFGTIVLPLNTLWHISTLDDQVRTFHILRRHARPAALLLVDLTNPLSMAERGSNGELRERFRGPSGDARVVGYSAAWDDEARQFLRLELTYDETRHDGSVTRTHGELPLRYVYRSELELLLRTSGWTVQAIYGSYDLDPYQAASPQLIAVARAG